MNILMTEKTDRYKKDCICNSTFERSLDPNAHNAFSLLIVFSHSSDSKTYFPFLLTVNNFLIFFPLSLSKTSKSIKLGNYSL